MSINPKIPPSSGQQSSCPPSHPDKSPQVVKETLLQGLVRHPFATLKQFVSKVVMSISRHPVELPATHTLKVLQERTASTTVTLQELQALNQVQEIRFEYALLETDTMRNMYLDLPEQNQQPEREALKAIKELGKAPDEHQIADVCSKLRKPRLYSSRVDGQIGGERNRLLGIRRDILQLQPEEIKGQVLESVAIFLREYPQATAEDVEAFVRAVSGGLKAWLPSNSNAPFRSRESVLQFTEQAVQVVKKGNKIPNSFTVLTS